MEENPQKYTKEQIQYLKGIECDHFWFKARRLLILRLLQRFAPRESSILEVGCGTGENLIALKQAGYHGIGLDLQSEGLKNPSLKFVQGDARSLPFQDAMFNVVLLADVLEHVEEEEVLPEVFRVLAPGGIALVTVPAYRMLWSHRDDKAGHLRRYNRRDLRKIESEYQWELEFLGGYQFFLFPLFLISRLFLRAPDVENKMIPGLNQLFFWINSLEVKLGIQWPFGSSLVAILRKNNGF